MKDIKPNNIIKITFLCILCFIHISCVSFHSNPSKVNISSLKYLVNYPMYNLEELKERLDKLEIIDGVSNFRNHEWKGDVGRSWVYNYYTPIVNRVYIWIYDNSENAKNHFEKWDKKAHEKLKNNIIIISEDIDVILWYSYPIRDEYLYYMYDVLYTCIRIGNIIINLDEIVDKNEKNKNGIPTTQNIEMICQVLIE